MKVTELTPYQLDILRGQYNYDVNDSTALVDENDIPDRELYAYYEGVEFVSEDFGSEYDGDSSDDSELRETVYNWAQNEFSGILDAGELDCIMNLI